MDEVVENLENVQTATPPVRRVLVVEDDEGLNNLAQRALRRAGFYPQGVLTGAEAIARVMADPDLILLLDQQLPDMAGTELIRTLLARERRNPFVVMTGHGDERVAVEMMKLGARDYLVKGFDLPDLLPEVFHRVFRQLETERRLAVAEQKLRESEERFRLLFENASQGIGYFDLDSRVIAFNSLAASRMGGQPADFVGKSMTELFGREAGAEYQRRLQIALESQGSQAYEDRVALPGGELWFLSTYTRITATGGQVNGVQVISVDITERKRTESEREITLQLLRQLSSANELHELMREITLLMRDWSGCEAVGIRLREGEDYPYVETRGFPEAFVLAESSLCAVDAQGRLVCDSQGNPVLECMCGNVICGRFNSSLPFFSQNGSFWTNSTTDLLASTTEEDRQARTRNRCHGEGYESVALIPLRYGAETFGLLQFNDPRRDRFDERQIALFERLAANLAIGLAQRRDAEALRESEKKFSTAFHTSPYAITITRARDGRFIEVNDAFTTITGFTRAETLANSSINMELWVNPEDRQGVVAALLEGQSITAKEVLFRRKNGEIMTGLFSAQLIHLKNESWILASINDITERKRAEAEKARLEEQFHQAQKLESIGRLAGGVAHDFNNMLSVILGHTEMALAQLDPIQPLFADLEEIRKAAQRSANLTRQLLAFARKQTVTPKMLDLNDTVESMLKMLRRLIGEDIDLAWLPRTGVWPVKVDPSQIDQILVNLCINARDAIEGVGKVTIETDMATFDQADCNDHAGFTPGEYALLAVSDNGCGMDKETLDNIFEPFFTTKRVDQGTGLGLATVYGIVKQNNGFINVYSEPGYGATFKIYLPRYVADTAPVGQESLAAPATPGHETILLVEDEPAILNVGKLMLENFGYRVLTALTPDEAMRVAGEHAGDIHLLITDVVMPEMNGWDLAEKLLSLYPGLKQLFMSGYTASVITHHNLLDETVNFIQKPFSMQVLAARVREVLESK